MDKLLVVLHAVTLAAAIGVVLYFGNRRLVRHYQDRAHLKFRQQLIQIGGVLLAVLLLIMFMPFNAELRSDLFSLYGLIISATIALSSTTLVGNVMAGIMLKAIGNCRPGDYVTIGDYFGRISEMDLLHTEIQTEQRDLTTLPNLYLVTHPVRVMQTSGTILTVDLSLGYDVSRHRIEKALVKAATDAGLESPFVQIVELGDFSVSYRISGLLTDIAHLIEKRRELRARTVDELHAEGIEIVSPTFMNQRQFDSRETFIPDEQQPPAASADNTVPDAIVFDKATKAESLEKLRKMLDETKLRLTAAETTIAEANNEKSVQAAETEKQKLMTTIERLQAQIGRQEEKIASE